MSVCSSLSTAILSMDDDDSLCRPLESLEDGECEPDCTCIGCVLANTTQDDPPPPPDEPDEPLPPIQLEQTRRKKAALHGQDLLPKVLCILDAISNEGLTLSLFLNALSWGDESCTANDRVRFARTGLLLSEELPDILARWYKPPRNKNKGRRPAGARQAMETFAINCVLQLLEQEMEHAATLFASPPSELSEIHLTSFDFKAFISTLKSRCPTTWRVIEQMSYSDNQRMRNTHKSPDMVCPPQTTRLSSGKVCCYF